MVGDDDQSIYGWRGADITNILEFEQFFPNPTVVKLEENYRCTMPILALANSVIKLNKNRREKTLWCQKESDNLVRLIGMPTAEDEAQIIVEEIMAQAQSESRPWEDFAILFRMNAQSRLLEQNLREHEVPYRVVGGMSFFDRREIKDLLSYLSALSNPADDLNLLRVINNPPRGIGATAIKAATEWSIEKQTSVWQALQDEDYLAERRPKSREAIRNFVDLMQLYGEQMRTPSADYPTLLGKLIEQIEYIDFVRRNCKTPDEANMREINAREFIDSMYDHRARTRKDLQHFLDEVSLMSDRDDDDISKKQGVCLITLHAAKGLEFPVVYMVGLEDGILPHSRSLEEGTKDEERRLLYVGITRGMESLTLTYCATRKRYGDKVGCLPSSFIKDFDMEYVDELSYDDLDEGPASEDEAAASFDAIKAMLAAGT